MREFDVILLIEAQLGMPSDAQAEGYSQNGEGIFSFLQWKAVGIFSSPVVRKAAL